MTGAICLVEHNRAPGNTLDLVEAAQALGHKVVVVTSDPATAADVVPASVEVIDVDTTDAMAVASALEARAVDGIGTAHDFYVPVAADAASLLSLGGPDPDAVHRCRRKVDQRMQLATHGVAQPRFALARSPREAVRAARDIGFPVIVKPVALADSIGVAQCESVADVADHVRRLAVDPLFLPRRPAPGHVAGEVLVESVLQGAEHTVEVFDGVAVATAQTRMAPPPFFVEYEHVVATPGDRERAGIHGVLARTAEDAVRALGPVHVELRLGGDGPAVVEVNARLAGGRIPRLLQLTHGVDLWESTVRVMRGEQVVPAVSHSRAGVLRFVHVANTRPQRTDAVAHRGFDGELVLLPRTPGVADRPTRSSEHAGWAIATGDTPDVCRLELDDLWSQLRAQLPIWPAVGEDP